LFNQQTHSICTSTFWRSSFLLLMSLNSTLITEWYGKVLPSNGLHVLLVCGIHWILLSTIQCSKDCVKVYDLAFHSHPKEVLLLIVKALARDEKAVRVSIMDTEMQPTPNTVAIAMLLMAVSHALVSTTTQGCVTTFHNVLKIIFWFPSIPCHQ